MVPQPRPYPESSKIALKKEGALELSHNGKGPYTYDLGHENSRVSPIRDETHSFPHKANHGCLGEAHSFPHL